MMKNQIDLKILKLIYSCKTQTEIVSLKHALSKNVYSTRLTLWQKISQNITLLVNVSSNFSDNKLPFESMTFFESLLVPVEKEFSLK